MSRMRSSIITITGAAACLLAVTQGFGQLEIVWHTIDGGGSTVASAGGSFEIAGTIGQPDAASSPSLTGGSYEVTGGFWPVANVCYCLGDMNGDGQKNANDVTKFVACLTDGGNCSCADVNAAGGVTLDDVSVFVADLLAGPACP